MTDALPPSIAALPQEVRGAMGAAIAALGSGSGPLCAAHAAGNGHRK
jgi:hypothetical protein